MSDPSANFNSQGFAVVPKLIDSAAASLNGSVRLALGCVDAVPVVLSPSSTNPDAVRQAVRDASLDPPSDVHASSDYRRHLAEVLAVRAIERAQRS